VYWLTDSENLVRFLTKGSRKKHIQQEVFRVILLCQKLRIRVIPIHLRREDPRIQIADSGSKDCDTDDWAVDLHTFRELNQSKDFTIDLFASDKNNKCTRFFSNYFCTGTNGIDAFCHSWEGEVRCPVCSLFQNGKQLTTGPKYLTKKARCWGHSPDADCSGHSSCRGSSTTSRLSVEE